VIPLLGVNAEDVLFFGQEWYPSFETGKVLLKNIVKIPVLYTMLLSISNVQTLSYKTYEKAIGMADYDIQYLPDRVSDRDFILDNTRGIIRLALREYEGFPHFSEAFSDSFRNLMLIGAITDAGFQKLSKKLPRCCPEI